MNATAPQDRSRILGWLARLDPGARLLKSSEPALIAATLAAVGWVAYGVEQTLSMLNVFFLPVLAAACFVSARSAVLAALLAVAWTGFLAVCDPDTFYRALGRVSLYLHLLSWASFLVLTGALVGRLSEELRARFAKARRLVGALRVVKKALSRSNRELATRGAALETARARVESVLHSAMDPAVARMLVDRRLRNEKRSISVLFSDLEDFTALSEGAMPELVIEDLNRFFTAVEPVILRHRGHVDKFMGDGLLAEFGAPHHAEHHALLACLAATEMQERERAGGFPWKMRVGVACGPALVGLVGSSSRRNYTAIGDPVNLAARLQELCRPGQVCVDEAVYRQVRRWFHARSVRDGLPGADAHEAESRLEVTLNALERVPNSTLCLEAARLCARLGDTSRSISLYKRALELNSVDAAAVEQEIARVVLEGRGRWFVSVKGRKGRVAVYELAGLKDPLDEPRLPPRGTAMLREAAPALRLPAAEMRAIEAAQGTLGHAAATAAVSAALAETLDLPAARRAALLKAAYLHDAGKHELPDALLAQEGRECELPPSEQALLRGHVREGARVLERMGVELDLETRELIAQHHECFDGTGYPDGLWGDHIAFGARIIAVADAYDTLTAWHPSAEPWEPRAALAELGKGAVEGRYDPRVVQALAKTLEPLAEAPSAAVGPR